jgi:hypothetical protein
MEKKYVEFNTAILLREKGFENNHLEACYSIDGSYYNNNNKIKGAIGKLINPDIVMDNNKVYAPEQHQVIDWLLEKHGIWIHVLPQDKSEINFRNKDSKYPSLALFIVILKYEENLTMKEVLNSSDVNSDLFLHFDSFQEAYSAAITYCLEQII